MIDEKKLITAFIYYQVKGPCCSKVLLQGNNRRHNLPLKRKLKRKKEQTTIENLLKYIL